MRSMCSRLAAVGMVIGLPSLALAPACSSLDEGGAPLTHTQHVRIDGEALAALKPGEKLVMDVREGANFAYHVYDAESLDLSRVAIATDTGEVPAKDIINSLLEAPYTP